MQTIHFNEVPLEVQQGAILAYYTPLESPVASSDSANFYSFAGTVVSATSGSINFETQYEIAGEEIPASLQEVLDNSSDYSWFIIPEVSVEKYDVTGYFAKATFTTNEKTKKSKLFTVSAIVNESSK